MSSHVNPAIGNTNRNPPSTNTGAPRLLIPTVPFARQELQIHMPSLW